MPFAQILFNIFKCEVDKVPNTTPSHSLADYAGEYVHPTYGILKIEMKDSELLFKLGKIHLPLTHFHYERFDTPDDERYGKWSVNFLTNPQGDANKVVMSIDEAEVTFIRQASVPDSQLLTLLAGTYKTPTEAKLQVVLKEDNFLYLLLPGTPNLKLIPYKNFTFQAEKFSDIIFEFVMENGRVEALKQREPSGVYVFIRQ
ncbi:hypothetical protein NIES2101_31955 [Calothrix sp. HK-06]|nr:hypothetical protein NIES2101_31955 [Calothrix sp. HK-06]